MGICETKNNKVQAFVEENRTIRNNYLNLRTQCTYDAYGDKYIKQDFFECITCWGKGSIYGVCRACGIKCHSGHELILTNSKSSYCDCGKYNHKIQLCTRQTTNFKFVKQSMYLCYDCFDIENYQTTHKGQTPGVCHPCAMRCHKNHNLQFYKVADRFYCDCGLTCCKINCKAK